MCHISDTRYHAVYRNTHTRTHWHALAQNLIKAILAPAEIAPWGEGPRGDTEVWDTKKRIFQKGVFTDQYPDGRYVVTVTNDDGDETETLVATAGKTRIDIQGITRIRIDISGYSEILILKKGILLQKLET